MASVVNSTSSICGIDVGSENCYVAVARQGGIEILLNEYSQRSTPAYIAFGGNQRELGVSAKQKQMMNLSSTCFAPSLIIGKKFKDLDLSEIPYQIEENIDGEVSVRVFHNGEEIVLTSTQVLAMLFTKLRQISGNPVDCVINCPNYFTDTQRRALIDAAYIAGLNPLKIIADMTAISLYYGFYRSSSSGQESTIVAFVDCGHTSTQASIVLFNHKENYMRVLDAEYQANVGGKYFDEVLANYFISKQKLQLNKRARCRLIAECEKVKKQMSANSNELPINIECLYNDRDFSDRIDRTKFEELSDDLFNKIKDMLILTNQRASEKYDKDFAEKLGKFRIDSVEIVGGTSRIPAIKRIVKDVLGAEISTTLNADEAVARGCALQCAILSPTFKVARELQISDSLAYQVDFRYASAGVKEFKTVRSLYPRGHQFPFTKKISIACQTLPITTAFDYVRDDGQVVSFAEFTISEPAGSNVSQYLQKNLIKLHVRVDACGLISITSASISYEKPEELEASNDEPMEQSTEAAPADTTQKMETEENGPTENNLEQPNAEENKKKSKPKPVTIELSIQPVYISGKLSKEDLQKFFEIESNLILADKNWKEKTDSRNALEEFIYEWRDRLESGGYDVFVDASSKASFQSQLEQNEKWLFDQDEQEIMHSKSVYEEKTSSMANAYANPIMFRRREFEARPRALEQLGQRLQQASKLTQSNDPDEQEDVAKFIAEIGEFQKWFDDISGKLANHNTTQDPPVKCDEISKQVSQLDSAIYRIQNSRKRRADEKRKAAEAAKKAEEAEKNKAAQPAGDSANAAPSGENETEKASDAPTKMEVDDQSSKQPQPTA